ncbi:MAG TPA: hypothetical protein VGM63_03775 [Mucilaginibacter sp.]
MIEIANSHCYSKGAKGFQISPLMQEKMVFAGQYDNYGNSNVVIERLLDQQISSAQVHRLVQAYGCCFGMDIQAERCMPEAITEEVVYAQVDGGMVLTRDQGWKETKLGRVFKSKDCLKGDESCRGYIHQSQYVAYLGEKQTFCRTMDELLDDYSARKLGNRLVFVTDGAVWIYNWIKDIFPDAVHILDYFHASEHLYDFVKLYYKDNAGGMEWGKQQETILQQGGVLKVIETLKSLPKGNKQAQEAQNNLIAYYQANAERMNYPKYKKIGAGIIGSGAIESAHRTVVQKRLKQSGQRWGIPGAQNVLNLRVMYMNNQWIKVIDQIKCAALFANMCVERAA